MSLRRSCGIIGFKHAGKKTLHDILQKASSVDSGIQAPSSARSIAKVPVLDPRIDALSGFCKNAKRVPVNIDILRWNTHVDESDDFCPKLLEDLRTVNALIQVVGCYGDSSPIDKMDKMNGKIIESDLSLVQKRLMRMQNPKKDLKSDVDALERIGEWLGSGKSARLLPENDPLRSNIRISELQLLSMKPVVYVMNMNESAISNSESQELAEIESSFTEGLVERAPILTCCAKVEEEVSSLGASEKASFMQAYGIDSLCHVRLPNAAYQAMPLHTFFTTGDTMTHAWSITKGMSAVDASAQIHSKFKKSFISAKVLPWSAFITHNGIASAEAAMMLKSRDYVMQDGDVMIVNVDKTEKK